MVGRCFFRLLILFPLFRLFSTDIEQSFVLQDPPPRPEAVEYELLPAADESIRAVDGDRVEWIRRLPGRSLVGHVDLQLQKEVSIPADSVRALIRLVDVSGDTLTVFSGRFDRDGRLEAAFNGVYASSVVVTLSGAAGPPSADMQISGIVLGASTRIMLIGDSITAGKFADDMIGFRKVIHDKLRAAGLAFDLVGGYGDPPYEGHFQGSMKINDFYPANLTPGARGRMDVTAAMNNFRPNIAVLHVGTNDLASEDGTPVAPYANGSGFTATQTGELGTLIRYLLRWNDGTAGRDLTAVVVCLIIPIKYEDSLCVAFNLEAARLVNDFRNGRITGKPEPVYLCDVFSRFREWPDLVENGYKALMYDKLHPNTAGHNLIGETLFETLAPLLGAPQKWFADVTAYAGLLGADHLFEHQGVAVADIDGDGREDALITRTNASASDRFTFLFNNTGSLSFAEESGYGGLEGRYPARGAVFFDMDNDGDLDLFLGVSGGRNRLYMNSGGSFRDITTAGGIADLPRVTTGVAAFDADNDGDLDLYAVNSREKNELYINQNGRFSLQNRGAEDVTEPNIPSLSLAAADVDADDDIDLYVVKRGAANKLFLNDGSGWFQEAAAAAGIDLVSSSNSAVFADLDNDGDLDLLIGVTASATDPSPNVAVFENVGGIFSRRNLNLPMDGYSILAEDFDNDGDLDLLVTQEESRAALYRNDGNWRFTLLTGTGAEIHAGDVRGAAAVDADADGDLDLLAARADMFNIFLRNQLNIGNHFLRVLARGPAGNAVGFGTKLLLFEAGRLGDRNALLGFQEVQSIAGHISQPSSIRHFGLKDRTACDLLARFSDGSYAAFARVSADQTLVIAPPESSANPEPAQLSLVGGDGQRGTVGERLSLPLAVKVTDRSGRPVSGSAVTFRVVEGDAELLTLSPPSGRIALPPETGQLTSNAVRSAGTDCADGSFVLIPPHRRGPAAVLLEKAVQSNEYTLWLRMRNPGATQSIRIRIDAGTPIDIACPNLLDWSWFSLPDRIRLTSGVHAFAIEFDGAVQLDQLLLCESADDRPENKGEISNSPELTNERGIAERLVRFGTRAGRIVVTAELRRNGEHISGSPQTFTLTALPGPAVSMRETSGNHQAGRSGERLAEPFVVTVYDAFGNPVPDFAVNFSVVSGGGTLTEGSTVLTNAEGRAQNFLLLGAAGTQQIVRAEAPLIGSPVLFYARTLLFAAQLRLLSGEGQTAPVLSTLPQPIVVQILSHDGQAVPDHPIRFSVSDEGAAISNEASFPRADTALTVLSDEQGKARIFWRLGRRAGAQRLIVNAGFLAGSPAIVTAEAQNGPPALLVKIGGDHQSGIVARPLPQPLAIRLLDAGGNPLPGRIIRFSALESDGSFGGKSFAAVATDSLGTASAVYTLGKTAGRRIVVQAETFDKPQPAGSPADFEAAAQPDSAFFAAKVSGDLQTAPVGETLEQPLVVKITDRFGNPVAGFHPSFVGGAEGAGFTRADTVSNENGLASAFLRLGFRAGTQQARVICPNLTPPEIEFSFFATAGEPRALSYLAGNGQTGSAGSILADSLLVKVTDAYDNPKSEWPVHFAMLSSVGSLEGESEKTVLTNSKGIAGVRLQLGEAVGDSIYIVEATSRYNGELLPHPVQFYASCRRLPPTRLVALTPTIGLRGAPQRPLPYSIVVQVLDSAGSPVAEVPVEWKVLQGGGSLNSPPSVSAVSSTNGLGKAEAVWILGRMGEPQLLSAACLYDGLPLSGSPILFRAETEAPRLDALAAVGDTLIRARPATVISLQVRTLDQFREPMADQLVTFSVLSGDARWRETIDPSLTLHSSAEGVVTAELITGVKPAVIEAVSFGPQGRLLGNAIVRFTVVPAGPRLIIAAGDGQAAPVGSRLPTPLTVRAVDENEQGIGGIEVTFTPTVGDGRLLDAAQQTTDAQGYATVGYQLGLKSGLHRIRAASALGEVEFSARAVAGEASQLVVVKGDGQTGVAGHPLNQKLIVQVKDAFDNGVPKVTVYFEPEQGFAEPPQAAADSLGFVGCEWTLGLEAGEQTLTARLEGTAQTRFTAAALPNQAPVLVLPDSIVVDENQPMRLTIEAHDPENDSLSIVVLNLPAGAQFDVAKREFSWHPNYDQAGRYSPVFYAADHLGAAAMRVLPIIVRNVNRPPVIAEEICRPTVRDLGAVHKNEPIDFYAAARDPDGDPLHFIWTVMGRPTALGQMFHFAPQTFNGAIEVKALVFDFEDTVSTSWRLHVVTSVEVSDFSAAYEPFAGVRLSWKILQNGTGSLSIERRDGETIQLLGATSADSIGYCHFLDGTAEAGKSYLYRLLTETGYGEPLELGRIAVSVPLPREFALLPLFPNPFNACVQLRLTLPQDSFVRLAVYDLLGRRVRQLIDCRLKAGCHTFMWDGKNEIGLSCASGNYLIRAESTAGKTVQKATLLK